MLASGEQLSHYKIISSIGAGGMGEVYLAEDTKLERQVALKILLPDVADDDERIRRFLLEARSASALNHPNILTVFEIGTYKELQYIATEFIKGDTLRDRMNGEPMKLRETLEITLQVAGALGAAHEAGIIHRDIKPENIMIREDGLVKVLDFGLAKLSGMAAESVDTTLPQFNTQPGVLVGTVAYMSPEQARGRKLDPRSDIFSLGIVMFELFTGQRPFEGEGHLDLISSILKDEAPLLRQVAPKLPQRLERIVEKTLRKDRDHRYQHIKDLFLDIEDLQEELKFEAKLNQSVQPTVVGGAFFTNPSELRSAFRTGISKTRRFTLLHAFFFVAFAATIIGSIWYFGLITGPTAPSPGSYKTTEVATWNSGSGELGTSARFSPDGKLIAFASTKSGSKNIWVTQTGSTEPRQITDDLGQNTQPIWSPKGDEVAYFSDRVSPTDPSIRIGTIWRVNALGGNPRQIGQLPSRVARLCRWLPSGKIYYQQNSDLYSLDIANGESKKIWGSENSKNFAIDISPDEKSVMFLGKTEDEWAISTSKLDENRATEVIRSPNEISGFTWSAEKNRLFYVSLQGDTFQIFVTGVGSGKSSRITASETDIGVTDASPDGRSIITTAAKEESNIWRVNVSDGQEMPLARDINVKIWPNVSPDNSKIVLQSVRNMSEGRHMYDTHIVTKPAQKRDDGEKPTLVAEKGFFPSWSPDGKSIVYEKKVDNKASLFLVNQTGGGERKISNGEMQFPGYATSPYNALETFGYVWSPDGSQIAYVSVVNDIANVNIIDIAGGSDSVITDNVEKNVRIGSPAWSPDGKKLAVNLQINSNNANEKAKRKIRLIDVLSKESLDIYESAKVKRLLGWTTDGNSIVIAETNALVATPAEVTIARVSVSENKGTVISDLINVYFLNIFLSDDKKSIAFAARNEDKDDLWVIPTTGSTARKITSNNDSGVYYSRLAWFHDGSAITFGKQTRFSLLSMISDID